MKKNKHKSGNTSRLELHPDELSEKLDKALKYHQAGKLQKAKALYQKVLKSHPDYNDALHMLGLVFHQSGDNNAALRLYNKAIANNQNSPELLTNFGNALEATGKIEDAIAAFKKAIAIKPNFSLAHNNLGNSLIIRGKNDEAIASFKKAVALEPNYADAYFNLGNLLHATHKLDEAALCFRQAIAIEPRFADAISNLGKLLMDKGDNKEAVSLFERAIELNKNNAMAQHLLAALQGRTTNTAPESYVIGLFDGAAGFFDQHLVEELDYKVPQYLQSAVSYVQGEKSKPLDILDIGCGTGLCGPLFKPWATKLVGVDIAPKMLKQAAERNVYDQLITGDILPVLRKTKSAYDIILAADVFIYIGDLKQIFEAGKKALKADGLFAFSVESGNDDDQFSLLTTGRYAHPLNYIRKLAAATGFREVKTDARVLRTDRNAPVNGFIVVLQNSA